MILDFSFVCQSKLVTVHGICTLIIQSFFHCFYFTMVLHFNASAFFDFIIH